MRQTQNLTLNSVNRARLRAYAEVRDLPISRVADELLRLGFEALSAADKAAVESRLTPPDVV